MKIKIILLLFLANCLLAFSNSSYAQITVAGTVFSKGQNKAIEKATIIVKGSSPQVGTSTDIEGNFSLTIPARYKNPILTVSSIGHILTEIKADASKRMSIVLEEAAEAMEDVVVIGYSTVRRKDLTGSVSSVGEKDLKDIPINSALEALTGRLAGVQISTVEGIPGAESKIAIRGGTSVNQDNSPLFIIDGVQVEDALNSISPQDIETVTVLKDASATAIYGARGSNGVVLITTKGGKRGKTRVNYNGFYGLSRLAKKLDVLNPYEYLLYQYERSRINTSEQTAFDNTYGHTFDSLSRFIYARPNDWQEMVLGENASMQTHNVSVSGGGKHLTFNGSYAYNQQQGTVINTSYKRHLFNFKTDYLSGKKFKAGVSLRYAHAVPRGLGTSDGGNASYNRLRAVVKYKPFDIKDMPVEEFDEDYFNQTNSGNSLGVVNPFVADNSEFRSTVNDIANAGLYADYKFNKNFSFRASAGYSYNDANTYAFFDTLSPTARQRGGGTITASLANRNNQTFNQSNVVTYTAKTKKSDLTILGGQEVYISRTEGNANFVRDISFGTKRDDAFDDLSKYTELTGFPLPSYFKSSLLSFFSRANYTYNRKYLFTATLRADGSSKFAPSKRWGYFPSASLAWRMSSEKFMKNLNKTFADVKFRMSYGATGNNRISDYRYQNSYRPTLIYALLDSVTNTGYLADYLANGNLTWETTIAKNIGLDVSLFNRRVDLSIDAYHNQTNDVLIATPIPSISGYTQQLQNIASTLNKGIEIQIGASMIQKKNFSWNANFNISFNENKVLKMSKDLDFYLESSGWGIGTPSDYIVKVGQPVGSMYGYIVDGIYTVNDFDYNPTTQVLSLSSKAVKNTIVTPQPGSIKFKDVNGDGQVTADDRDIIGNANPKFFGGLNQQFVLKNFDASIFVNFQYGNKVFNANKLEFTNGFAPGTNMLALMVNRWRTIDENGALLQYYNTTSGVTTSVDPTKLAEVNRNSSMWIPLTSAQGYLPTSFAVEDGSFIRINNITMGYTINPTSLKRIGINRLRVYATLNNVAIITNYSGFDPEVSTRRSSPVTPGVDYSAYPRSRNYLVGVNLSF